MGSVPSDPMRHTARRPDSGSALLEILLAALVLAVLAALSVPPHLRALQRAREGATTIEQTSTAALTGLDCGEQPTVGAEAPAQSDTSVCDLLAELEAAIASPP